MKTILDAQQIKETVANLVDAIVGDADTQAELAVVGIRSRGEPLAERIAAQLRQRLNTPIPCGVLDITLYRDDLNDPHGNGQPVVRTTEISFDVNDKILILVDDVLFTGRSTRAALEALIALGRPRAIRLAVLIDRAGREFPIQADYAGHKTNYTPDQRIHVHLVECDHTDEVLVE